MHKCQGTPCGRRRVALRDFTIGFSTLFTETQSHTEPRAVAWAPEVILSPSPAFVHRSPWPHTPGFCLDCLGIWTRDLMLVCWAISSGSHKMVDYEGQLVKRNKAIRSLRLPGPRGAEHCAHTIPDPIRCLGYRPFHRPFFYGVWDKDKFLNQSWVFFL